MSKKDDRRLVVCEQCGQTYPGFQHEDGGLHVVGGPTCPNCESSSFVEVNFGPSLTLSCPNCGTEQRERVGLSDEIVEIETTGYDPDGIILITCNQCDEEFSVGYETTN